MYEQLAHDCTSVPELTLKLAIFGKEWKQWDWAFFFVCLASPPPKENAPAIYKDIIETIDTSKELDSVMTNRQVILSIIELLKIYYSGHDYISITVREHLTNVLAHVFKKFPCMWTMSWMWTKTYDRKTLRTVKVHKLKSFSKAEAVEADDKPPGYYTKDACFNSFQALHYIDCFEEKQEDKN